MKLRSSILAVVFALMMTAGIVSPVSAAVSWSVTIAPPPLPVYAQPLSPGPDYLWTPGYWAWNGDDYYWVPATWVLAPQPGFLWTPGYWGWRDGFYVFNEGYWGPTIGFYGGINYGFGYWGHGYDGGRWQGDHFFYNRSVTHVDETIIKNVYTGPAANNVPVNNVSYNGGSGGVRAEATPAEMAAARENHLPPVAAQRQHAEAARNEPQLRAAVNHGHPSIVATQRPDKFSGPEMAARQEQKKRALEARQDGDRQRVAAKKQHEQEMEQEHQRQKQEMQQEHQRQQQELEQRHAQEREQMQAKHKRPKPDEEEHHG